MRELMVPPIPFPTSDHIKSVIMMEAVRLFALKGYQSVSVKDIAAAANLRPSVVFNHFVNKEEVMERIMLSAEEDIRNFYSMLIRLSEEAESFEQIINNIFIETKEVVNPSAFYSIYCAMTHQFTMECCRRLYFDVYFAEGHMVMQRQLHTAIRRGLVGSFDVPQVAATITNCFLAMISLNVGHLNGFYPDFDPAKWYERQIEHVLQVTRESVKPMPLEE